MSNKQSLRIGRSIKASMQWLDYVAQKSILRSRMVKHEQERLTVSERIRFKYHLFWKYGAECAYCGRAYDWREALTLDHLQPVSHGGLMRDVRNMVLACLSCNRAKGNSWID